MVRSPRKHGKGMILEEIMYEERISQRELGDMLGINQQSVSAMLKRDIKVGRLKEVCEALGYEVVIRKDGREYRI